MKTPQSADAGYTARERIVQISPAWDKRNTDPKKNYGVHCAELRMVLKGKEGAVQFLLFTNWNLPHVVEWWKSRGLDRNIEPTPADLGYHSKAPMYEGQSSMGPCEYCDGADCYYDGSGLNAEPIYETLLNEGSNGVWRKLEEYYDETFATRATPNRTRP